MGTDFGAVGILHDGLKSGAAWTGSKPQKQLGR